MAVVAAKPQVAGKDPKAVGADVSQAAPVPAPLVESAAAARTSKPTAGTSKVVPAAGTSKVVPAAGTSKVVPAARTSRAVPAAKALKPAPAAGTSKAAPAAAAGTEKTAPVAGTSKSMPTAATSKATPMVKNTDGKTKGAGKKRRPAVQPAPAPAPSHAIESTAMDVDGSPNQMDTDPPVQGKMPRIPSGLPPAPHHVRLIPFNADDNEHDLQSGSDWNPDPIRTAAKGKAKQADADAGGTTDAVAAKQLKTPSGKQKGGKKQRADTESDEDGTTDAAGTKQRRLKTRRQVQGIGQFHETPCSNCVRSNVSCEIEMARGACFRCAKNKGKCEYAGPKGGHRTKGRGAAMATKQVEKKRPEKKSKKYVEVTDEESEEERQPAQAPAMVKSQPANDVPARHQASRHQVPAMTANDIPAPQQSQWPPTPAAYEPLPASQLQLAPPEWQIREEECRSPLHCDTSYAKSIFSPAVYR